LASILYDSLLPQFYMIKNTLVIIFGFLSFHLVAQDNALSQFFANRIYLNPAFAGIDKGLQVTSSARSQWQKADGGYKFAAFTAEWQEPGWNSGIAFHIQGSREGLSPFKTFGIGLTYAYIIPFEYSNVHVGLQYSYNQFGLDWSRLTFSDELDPVFGAIYGSAVVPGSDKVVFHDFAMGAVWRFDSRMSVNKRAIRRYRSHVGLSVQHLTSLLGQGPDASFLQSDTEIPARITLHGGTIIPLTFLSGTTRKIILSPNFKLESQGFQVASVKESFTLFSAGTYFVVDQIVSGAFYHSRALIPGRKHTNACTFVLGFTNTEYEEKRRAYYLGLSVDINATGLGIKSGNVFELNFRYNIKGIRPISEKKHAATTRKTVLDCKDFY